MRNARVEGLTNLGDLVSGFQAARGEQLQAMNSVGEELEEKTGEGSGKTVPADGIFQSLVGLVTSGTYQNFLLGEIAEKQRWE